METLTVSVSGPIWLPSGRPRQLHTWWALSGESVQKSHCMSFERMPVSGSRFYPQNHFAEVEQAAFSVGSMVPGIGLSPDKMLMGRIFSYHDTHLHRIGANYEQLPINAPKSPVHSYNKDGAMTFRNPGAQPVYSPNSYGGPEADPAKAQPSWWVEAGEIGRYAYELHREDDDFGQPRTLYRDVMDETDREHLATNIVAHAGDGVSAEVQERVIGYWTNVDAELGARVAAGLGSGNGAEHPAARIQEVAREKE